MTNTDLICAASQTNQCHLPF